MMLRGESLAGLAVDLAVDLAVLVGFAVALLALSAATVRRS
jgi:hypothetical protein